MANRSRIIRGKTFEDIVECQICGFKIKNTIQSHIRFKHPEISCKEYVVKYDAEIMSEEARNRKAELMKGKNSGRVQSEEERKVRSDKNKKFYEEHPDRKDEMAVRQKAIYDSGEHPLFREEVRQQRREWMAELNKTEKQRAIVSNYMKNEYVCSEETRKKMSILSTGRLHSVETKNKISRIVSKQFKDGRKAPHFKKYANYVSTKTGKECFVMSKFEKIYFEMLDSDISVKDWISEPFSIRYELDGEEHSYFPDVLVDNKYLVEVKSKYYWYIDKEMCEAKAEAARVYCKQHNLEYKILYEEDLGLKLNIPDYMKDYVFPKK